MELLNMDWCRKKVLKELRTKFDHGHNMFVEKNDIKTTKFKDLEWHKAIMSEQENLKLYINASEVTLNGQDSL